MHTDIINEYIDKEVEVSTTSTKNFTGTMKHHDSIRETVTIGPSAYYAKKYGAVIIRQHDIVTIREVLPQIEEDEDDCDDKQMVGQGVLASYDFSPEKSK
jgi:small nuclear ribonucleoprotein (snRNP)-like protein